ncbi:MAG TPA: hypothetical protein VLF91_01595 [Candidatus Saccharimonadales bacterium]|nr:hypothetical protein [Candidatus Saccharimonadales bacterium]
MSETIAAPRPQWQQDLFDYYLGRDDQADQRAEFEANGWLPTNNLSLYIVDEPKEELVAGTGIPNRCNYNARPFGHIVRRLRDERRDLWEAAKSTAAVKIERMDAYIKALQGKDPVAAELAAQVDTAQAEKNQAYTDLMLVLGPWLVEEGFSPLELCG